MTDSHFMRSLGVHAVTAALLAGGVMLRPSVDTPAPEAPAVEVADAPPLPPPTPAEKPAAPPPAPEAAEPPPPAPPAPAPERGPVPEAKVERRELERQGGAFFASGGTYEDLPLRWNRMEPSQSQFLLSTRAGIWVYSEATHCYVAKARMTEALTLEVTRLKGCSENPAHAVGGRISAKNPPFAAALARLEAQTGDDSLLVFSDHRNDVRRYIAGVVMAALKERAKRLEEVGQVLLEGAVSGGEPVVRVVGLCDNEDNCS